MRFMRTHEAADAMSKVLLIICDGMSDRPIAELSGKTPLEAAYTPHIDAIACRGVTGLMHPVAIGVRPGSDVAHLSIFGYDIATYYTGRGPFEAAGYDMDVSPGDVALRGNFATVDETLRLVDRRAGRIDDTDQLITALREIRIPDVSIDIRKGTGHRLAFVFRGAHLDGNVTDIDPHEDGVPILSARARDSHNANAKRTADMLNAFVTQSFAVLSRHPYNRKRLSEGKPPATIVLLRGAGSAVSLPSFSQTWGFSAACIAGAGLYKGIAKLLSMKVLSVTGATGKPDTDVHAKISAALSALDTYSFVFVHIKAADSLAEDGNFLGKKDFIETIDAALAPLVARTDILIALTSDHTTSSYLRRHTADPVPLVIAGSHLPVDHVLHFGERSVVAGRLGQIHGRHLLPILRDFIGTSPLLGA